MALGGGGFLGNHSPKCFEIFLMTSWFSIKLMIRIFPWHLGQSLLNRVPFGKFNRARKGINLINLLNEPGPVLAVLL